MKRAYTNGILLDGTEQMELVVGEPTEMFPAGGILCQRSGFGDYENQYFWQSKVFDGKLFLGTFDTSSLLEPLGQFTNGDLLHMSRDEWASQIGYLKVLLKLLLNSLLRQPAVTDLIHHRLNRGINGREGPGIAHRLLRVVAIGNANQRPRAQQLIVERPWLTE